MYRVTNMAGGTLSLNNKKMILNMGQVIEVETIDAELESLSSYGYVRIQEILQKKSEPKMEVKKGGK